jgi:murein DD-endopeptidase MepM/ murein hydrolase activator NlpD
VPAIRISGQGPAADGVFPQESIGSNHRLMVTRSWGWARTEITVAGDRRGAETSESRSRAAFSARWLAEDEEGNAVRDSGRPGVVRMMTRVVLAAALLLAIAGNHLARAQDEFDLPELDDYSGLQAITANSVDGVNVRAEPGVESEVLISVPDGNVVDLRVDAVRTVTTDDGIRWWPISIWEVDGWVAGIYLAPVDGEAESDDSEDTSESDEAPAASAGDPAWAAGDYVASTTDFLAMRAGPGTSESRIAWLGEGDVVQIVDGPFFNGNTDWWLITDGSINAYVFGSYLTTASELDLEAPEEPAAEFAAGDTVGVALGSGGANIRNEADAESKRLGSLNEGAIVTIVDGPAYDSDGGAWYLVDLGDDSRGYVTGEVFEILTAEQVAAATAPEEPEVPESGPTGIYRYPLTEYRFTQGYGCTIYTFEPYNATLGCPYHNGIDLAAPLGTPMLASDGGTIKYAGWCDCGLGLYIEIDHENGTSTVYGHMNAVYVETGDKVNQGDTIGEIGSTGFSTGPHVHFMLKIGDGTVNPLDYLSE